MKCEWKKWQWIEGEWLTQFCCSGFYTCFYSPFGNYQQCSNVWPPLLLISHPPFCWWWSRIPLCPSAFPLAISPCHCPLDAGPLIACSASFCSFVPLLPFTQCSTSDCLFNIAIVIGVGHIGARWWHWWQSCHQPHQGVIPWALLVHCPVGHISAHWWHQWWSCNKRQCVALSPLPLRVIEHVIPLYRCLVCRVVLSSCLLRCIVEPLVEWWHGIRLGVVGGTPLLLGMDYNKVCCRMVCCTFTVKFYAEPLFISSEWQNWWTMVLLMTEPKKGYFC